MREGKSWTKEDDQELLKLFKEGKLAKEVAIELGRSMGAVYARRHKLGATSKLRTRWTIAEENKLKELFNEGKSDEEIGELIGRSPNSVKHRRLSMRLVKSKIKPWTEEDKKQLDKLVRKGKDNKEIAKALGRTESSIIGRRAILKRKPPRLRESGSSTGLKMKIKPLKKGQDYLVKTTGTGMLNRQETSREIVTYKGNTDDLLIFERENYTETYTRVDVALGEVSIREATKTDYQTIQ